MYNQDFQIIVLRFPRETSLDAFLLLSRLLSMDFYEEMVL